MAKKVIHVVTQRNWQAEELQAKGWETRQCIGLDVPMHEAKDSWWMPQAFAARIKRSLDHHNLPPLKLTAPNSSLLPDTPRELSGRRVGIVSVYDAQNSIVEWPDGLWWKMATAKHDDFICQPLSHEELMTLLEKLKLPEDSLLQYSEELTGIISEHRFFIANRKIKAHSGYLKGEVTVYDGATFTEEETSRAIAKVEELLGSEIDLPKAFVIDVALTTEEAFILEYNPAWCSGWYDCDVRGVLETIKVSTHPTKRELKLWGYQPDAMFSNKMSVPLPLQPPTLLRNR